MAILAGSDEFVPGKPDRFYNAAFLVKADGTDGGFYVTYDRGANWDHMNQLALGQFYHVAVCNKKPYWIYGGLQDNGSWGIPSMTLRGAGPSGALRPGVDRGADTRESARGPPGFRDGPGLGGHGVR